jgi:putative RNA 2'-phosphotransferase
MNVNVVEKGKKLAWLLRHDKESFDKGLIDEHGWRKVDEIIKNYHYTSDLLQEIVDTNNKQRYEYNDDKTLIRARQGHSIPVDVELKETTPPDILYHGTCDKFINDILKDGLKPQTRLYVHLSKDIETATNVGRRHGKPVILSIDSKKMYEDGIKFYLSNNGVWLTKFVDKKYFRSKI